MIQLALPGNVSRLGEDEFKNVFNRTNPLINSFYILNPGSIDNQDQGLFEAQLPSPIGTPSPMVLEYPGSNL